MQFEFESECGLKVIHTEVGLRCVLSEIDARVHGHAPYYSCLHVKRRDPLAAIRAAGWNDFEYDSYRWDQNGRTAQVQLADLFGICLYLATVPKDNVARRRGVYDDVCQTLEVSEQDPYELMEQVGRKTPFTVTTPNRPQPPFQPLLCCAGQLGPPVAVRQAQWSLQLPQGHWQLHHFDTA